MLKCDGFKMFHGTVTITPANGKPPYDMTGTWLYNPERRYWYCEQDNSDAWWAVGIDPDIMSNIRDDASPQKAA